MRNIQIGRAKRRKRVKNAEIDESTKKEQKYNLKNENLFLKLIEDSFKMKRKTLRNNLKNYNWSKILEILSKYNLPDNIRAEELSIDIFIDIANNLS